MDSQFEGSDRLFVDLLLSWRERGVRLSLASPKTLESADESTVCKRDSDPAMNANALLTRRDYPQFTHPRVARKPNPDSQR